ncbi:hypothetical protein RIF29_13669 [Crotalaria pallida]|uniref:Uncharacterized protein n=1 Tax=Crotalaria pallida TaxID=3830 RepID=A0AAN9IPM4_CROPI
MAQWIRRWSTEPEILGSIPSGVVFFFYTYLLCSSLSLSLSLYACSSSVRECFVNLATKFSARFFFFFFFLGSIFMVLVFHGDE